MTGACLSDLFISSYPVGWMDASLPEESDESDEFNQDTGNGPFEENE
jgi:hypothetical protein